MKISVGVAQSPVNLVVTGIPGRRAARLAAAQQPHPAGSAAVIAKPHARPTIVKEQS
jgi:hypothetical protein